MKTGRVMINLQRQTYRAEWRVVGRRVEVNSELGTDSALLGPLASAPATVAREKLVEMAKEAQRMERPRPDTTRFNIGDA
jgi:hypothetical protein